MTDAATALAKKIKAKHISSAADWPGTNDCLKCEQFWPCDAVLAADMLLELARDKAAVDWILNDAAYKAPEQFDWMSERWLNRLHAARNATKETPGE